nr:uncharacterized protein LOC109621338 [Aedes albopictus]
MAAFKVLSGFAILVSLLQLSFGQELHDLLQEGSGLGDDVVTPSLVDDYVICPPDDGRVMNVLESDENRDETDYWYDYDDLYPAKAAANDDPAISKENATLIELIDDDLLADPTQEVNDELNTAENEPASDVVEDEEASGDVEDLDGSIQLIRAPEIYNLPASETLDNKFNAFTEEHPEEIVLLSPNYPEPYPNVVNSFEDYTVTGGIGVQITIHDVDLDHESDFLFFRGGPVTDKAENGPIVTGKITSPLRFLIPHTTTFSVHFVSQHDPSANQTHKGFRLTYAPFGTVASPTTPSTTEMIVPREELQWVRREVSISRNMMVSVDMWPMVKSALANASNAYVEKHQLKYQPCRPDDIRILAQKCPDTWPGYEECVSLEFAVPLRPIVVIEEEPEGLALDHRGPLALAKGFIKLTTTEEPEPEYQLAKGNLELMWDEFGALALSEVGIEVYKMPENAAVLMIWIAISVCILAAFIFVLYSIWKIDFFKDYRRISKLSREPPDEDRSELKKKEFDISMFPSPHQIVPSLFPTGDPYGDRAAEPQYAYDNSTMNPWAEDGNDPTTFPNNSSLASHSLQPPKQQVFEPLSPLEYSPSIVDFNEIPETRSPRRSRNNNPFLPPPPPSGSSNARGAGGGADGGR